MLRDILPERDPLAHVERKVWEFALLALFLEEAGRLSEETSALAVGAGDERMVFWLANQIGRVVATDIYGEGSFADREATATMLTDPASHAPFPYREDRLEVVYADARELPFPDEAFDVVFSLSSIEHFGGPGDVARAAREMGRVLKPGGHALVATECFVRLDPRETALADSAVRALTLNLKRKGATPRRRLIEGFTARELRTRIVRPSGLELVQPLDLSLSRGELAELDRHARRRQAGAGHRGLLPAHPAEVRALGVHVGMSALAKSPRRGLIVLGLLLLTLGVGALALPSIDDMGDVGIIEFELARTSEQASEYYGELGESGRDAAEDSLYLDYPYLILYALFYGFACLVVAARAEERGMARLAGWGRPLAWGSAIAAACDAAENLALLRVLDGHTDQPWPGLAFTFASVKFLLLTAATIYIVVGFLLTLRASKEPSGAPSPG